jgi:hypothetical protein
VSEKNGEITLSNFTHSEFSCDELRKANENYQSALNRFNSLPANSEFTDLLILELNKSEIEVQIALRRARMCEGKPLKNPLFQNIPQQISI